MNCIDLCNIIYLNNLLIFFLSDNPQVFPPRCAGLSARSLPPAARPRRDAAGLRRAAADGGAGAAGLHIVALGRGAWVAGEARGWLL